MHHRFWNNYERHGQRLPTLINRISRRKATKEIAVNSAGDRVVKYGTSFNSLKWLKDWVLFFGNFVTRTQYYVFT